jgi:hypothetical protein
VPYGIELHYTKYYWRAEMVKYIIILGLFLGAFIS